MAETLYLAPDVLLHPRDGRWLASNPRLRSHVEVDAAAVAALAGQRATATAWVQALAGGRGRDATSSYFGERGLHADHSGVLCRDMPWLVGEALLQLLRQRAILISCPEDLSSRLAPLDNVLDRHHLGSFHQRVGQYLLLKRRVREPWKAWQEQKFNAQGDELLPGNYRHVQAAFFDSHFAAVTLRQARVLDFGCGNGYFSARFARMGATVMALDSSPELIAVARANHGSCGNIAFHLTADFSAALAVLSDIEAQSIDLIYLQDTLLLLLVPEQGEADPQLGRLLRAFHRILKPEGRLCAMEPNPVFWLAGRYGDPAAPYAVVTEYRHPLFNVAPTLDQLLPVMHAAGFALGGYTHPQPSDGSHPDYAYIAEYPIWDFFTFLPLPCSC